MMSCNQGPNNFMMPVGQIMYISIVTKVTIPTVGDIIHPQALPKHPVQPLLTSRLYRAVRDSASSWRRWSAYHGNANERQTTEVYMVRKEEGMEN